MQRVVVARGSGSPLLASLANRDFFRLWAATGLSTFGDMLTTTGLALVAYTGQRSILAVGAVFAARSVPSLVLGPLAGQLSDMIDRRRLLVAMDLLRAALVATLPFAVQASFGAVLAITVAVACASVLFQPARTSAVPDVLPETLLDGGNSAMAVIERVAEIAGYGAAAYIIIAVSSRALFAVDVLTFVVSALLLGGLRLRPSGQPGAPAISRVIPDIIAGYRHIIASRQVRSVLGLSFLVVTFASGIAPLTVQLAMDKLHAGGGGFALLEGSMAVGAAVGAIFVGSRRRIARGPMIVAGILGLGASYIAMGLTPGLAGVAMFFALNGAANMLYLVPLRSVIQVVSAGPYRGRVIAAWLASIQLAILLGVGTGSMLSSIQAPAQVGTLFVAAGLAVVMLGLLALRFRRADAR